MASISRIVGIGREAGRCFVTVLSKGADDPTTIYISNFVVGLVVLGIVVAAGFVGMALWRAL